MKKLIFLGLFIIVAKLAPLGAIGLWVPTPSTFGALGPMHSTFSVFGIAHADAPVAAEMAPADVAKWLAFFDKLVTTVVDTQRACDKMAVDVNSVMETNKDAIALAKQAKASGRKLPADAKAKMVDGVKKMMPGMQNCGQNDKVRAAFAKLDLNH